MNLRGCLFAAATATALVGATAPVQAASLSSFLTAGKSFSSSSGFSFAKDTTVKFTFLESRGAYQSQFGIYTSKTNGAPNFLLFRESQNSNPGSSNSNDNMGACGVTVVPSPCEKSFTFAAGTSYFLGLNDFKNSNGGTINRTTFSDDPIGPSKGNGARGMLFVEGPGSHTYSTSFPVNPAKTNTLTFAPGTLGIFVNDSYEQDLDGNDFIVKAEAVPEPATLAGLGLVAGSLVMSRRRKSAETA